MRALMVESDMERHSDRWREGHKVCCLQKCILSLPALIFESHLFSQERGRAEQL